MSIEHASSNRSTAQLPAKSSILDVWLSAVTYWYLTGLLAALGFSLGFYLVKPASGTAAENRDFLDAFNWMDGKWYNQIAREGYRYDPDARSNVAFFPVYPLLARGLIAATGMRAEIALLIVSNASLLAALAMLAFYVRARYRDAPADLADFTVLAAALFPIGCFFRLAYSESTFFLLATLSMYAMFRRWPRWATALVVGLATAARPVGVALLVPFAIHIVRGSAGPSGAGRAGESAENSSPSGGGRLGESGAMARDAGTERTSERITSAVLPLSFPLSLFPSVSRSLPLSWPLCLLCRLALYLPLACWGLAAFMAFQWRAFDEPFAVFQAHEHWRIRPAVSWTEKATALAELEPLRAVYHRESPAFWASYDRHGIPWFSLQFANPLIWLAAVALIAFGASCRWLSLEETSLAALTLLIPYLMRGYEMGMGSTGRFVAVVFPLYLVLGHGLARLPNGLRACLFALSAFFLNTFTALYAAEYVFF